MKRRSDPRHKVRQKIVQELFALSFASQKIGSKSQHILDKLIKVDKIIEGAAPEFPIKRINKIDLAILRLAVYELLVDKKEPPKVILDEAIELGKEFGGDTSSSFINGALGKIYGKRFRK